MPIVGLGVWRMEKEGIRDLILNAIKIGYRHLDCAGIHLFSQNLLFLIFVASGLSKYVI
jgi:diketogulonate reductase-like aldo/keto reductase